MHHQIDSLAHTNHLRSLPPEHKLGFAIALFVLSYLAPPYLQLLITIWLILWTVGYARIPPDVYFKLLAIPVSFWLVSLPALILGMQWGSDPFKTFPDMIFGIPLGEAYIYLSQQGLTQARILLTRALALTACLYFILFTVPFLEIVRVLRRVGCPVLLTELLSLMYRFIFVLAATASELVTAQQARFGYGNWRSGLRSLSLVVVQLLRRTFDNYRQISLGLTSRGFNGELRVCHTRRYKPSRRYELEAVGGYCLLLILVGLHYAHGI